MIGINGIFRREEETIPVIVLNKVVLLEKTEDFSAAKKCLKDSAGTLSLCWPDYSHLFCFSLDQVPVLLFVPNKVKFSVEEKKILGHLLGVTSGNEAKVLQTLL